MNNSTTIFLIWISDPINSGKSTIATLLTKRLKNAVNIELDVLSLFDTNLEIDQKLNFIIQDGLDLARNWTNRGFIPILNWPLYGDEVRFMLEYSNQIKLNPVLFNLTPPIDVVKRNRGEREIEDWEIKRIEYMYKECKMGNPTFGYDIDNTALTSMQTTDLIVEYLSCKNLLT